MLFEVACGDSDTATADRRNPADAPPCVAACLTGLETAAPAAHYDAAQHVGMAPLRTAPSGVGEDAADLGREVGGQDPWVHVGLDDLTPVDPVALDPGFGEQEPKPVRCPGSSADVAHVACVPVVHDGSHRLAGDYPLGALAQQGRLRKLHPTALRRSLRSLSSRAERACMSRSMNWPRRMGRANVHRPATFRPQQTVSVRVLQRTRALGNTC
jgi:hypothetical protein